jgi:uncharacterized protein (TIGR04255 family)
LANHTPWRKPPIHEVVLEIRFPEVEDYDVFVGGMALSFRDAFPIRERLFAQSIPNDVIIPGLPKHRFFAEDRRSLFHTGSNVLAINTLKYETFELYIEFVKAIIEAAQNFIDLGNAERLSLRYINRFDKPKDIFSILQIDPPFRDLASAKTKGVLFQYSKQENEDTVLNTTVVYPLENGDLILDLEAVCTPEIVAQWSTQDILQWAMKAHDEIIWVNFDNLISSQEKEVRQ